MKKKSVYQIITDKIIEQLEQGVIPWRKPWINGIAVNWLSQKPYRGVNAMLLDAGEYATFKQIKDAGGKVKRGEKSEQVIFWTMRKVEDKETGKEESIPFARIYNVFNVITQVEGIESKRTEKEFTHDPIVEAERIVSDFMDAPELRFASGRAYYRPSMDYVSVPPLKDYPNLHEYYSTLFHEMVHATGHKSRLNREGVTGIVSFGSETYSKEELVAEVGAAMLCGIAQIDNHTIDNSASYIQSWLGKLKEDPKFIVQAAGQAQKAADYMQNIKF